MIPKYITENKEAINNKPEQILSLGLDIYNHDVFNEFPVMKFIKNKYINENRPIEKNDVIELYRNKDYYKAVVCTMIWGGINATRAQKKEDTFFYKFLKYPEASLIENLEITNDYLKNNYFKEAFEHFENKAKIEGVGSSYFTKIFYFLGQANPDIKIKPLILDKWTENAYLALLLQNGELDKVKRFYKGINLKFSNSPGSVELNSKHQSKCYQSYVEDFDKWSKIINSNSSKLEEFVFGEDLRKNKKETNTRIQLWSIIVRNLNQIIPI